MKTDAEQVKKEYTTRVLPCACTNAYQDARYGKNKRVFNLCGAGKDKKGGEYRCTSCGREVKP